VKDLLVVAVVVVVAVVADVEVVLVDLPIIK
jgi:hypothetical protein